MKHQKIHEPFYLKIIDLFEYLSGNSPSFMWDMKAKLAKLCVSCNIYYYR